MRKTQVAWIVIELLVVTRLSAQTSLFVDTVSGFVPTELCSLSPKGDTDRFVLVGITSEETFSIIKPAVGIYRLYENNLILDTMYTLHEPELIDTMEGPIFKRVGWVACSERDTDGVYVGWAEIITKGVGDSAESRWVYSEGIVSANGDILNISSLELSKVQRKTCNVNGDTCIAEQYIYWVTGNRGFKSISEEAPFLLNAQVSRYLIESDASGVIKDRFLYSFNWVSFIQHYGSVMEISYPGWFLVSQFKQLNKIMYPDPFFKKGILVSDTFYVIYGSFRGELSEFYNGSSQVLYDCDTNDCGFVFLHGPKDNDRKGLLFIISTDSGYGNIVVSNIEFLGGALLRIWYNVGMVDSVWLYFKIIKDNRLLFYDSLLNNNGSYSLDIDVSRLQIDNVKKWAGGGIGPQFTYYWSDSLYAWGGNIVDSMQVDSKWLHFPSAYLFREGGGIRKDFSVEVGINKNSLNFSRLGNVRTMQDTYASRPFNAVGVPVFSGFALRDFIESRGKIIAVAYSDIRSWYAIGNNDTILLSYIDKNEGLVFENKTFPASYAIVVIDCPPIPSDSLLLREINADYRACEFNVPLRDNSVYKTDTFLFRPDSFVLEVSFKDGCYWSDKFRVALWDTIPPTYDQFCGDLTVSVPVLTEGVELWTPSGQVAFIDTTIGTYQLPDTGTYWLRLYDTIGCYIGWSDTFHVWKVGIDSFLLGYEEFCGSVELFGLSDFDIPYYVYRDTLLYLVDTATLFNVDSPGTYIIMLLDSATCRYAQTDPINVEYAGVDTFDIPFDLDCEALVLPDSLSDEQWYVIKDSNFVGVFAGSVVPASESGVYYLWAIDSSVCRYYRSGGSFVEVMQYDTLLLPVSYQCGNLWVSGGDTLSGRYYLVYEGDTVYVSDSSSFWIDSAGLYWVVYIDTTGCVVGYSDSVLVRRSEVSYPLTIRYSEGVLYVEGVKDVSNVVLYSTSGSVGSVPVLVFSSGVCELCPEKPKHRFKVSDLAPGVYVAEIVTKKGNRFYKKVIVR